MRVGCASGCFAEDGEVLTCSGEWRERVDERGTGLLSPPSAGWLGRVMEHLLVGGGLWVHRDAGFSLPLLS